MMTTRASAKRKRVDNSKVKNKKFKTSRSSYEKRSKVFINPESSTRASISMRADNIDINEDDSIEKGLMIDCSNQAQHSN